MTLRITTTYQERESVREFTVDSLMIGRLSADASGLDLSADPCVSRQHAFLQFKNGACWLTDLGSRYGTQVNGREIRGQGEWRLWPEDTVVIGETALRIVSMPAAKAVPSPGANASPAAPTLPAEAKPAVPAPVAGIAAAIIDPADEVGRQPPSALPSLAPAAAPAASVRILQMIDTGREVSFKSAGSASPAERRLAILLDLPRQFGSQTGQNELLQIIMNRVVEVIPAARRGALLLRDPRQDTLLLKAYVSADEPAVSETLARRAVEEKRGFIWKSNAGEDASVSMKNLQIVSGMYAPLRWQDQVYGVICVDSPSATDSFVEDDLQFLIALGQYAAMELQIRSE